MLHGANGMRKTLVRGNKGDSINIREMSYAEGWLRRGRVQAKSSNPLLILYPVKSSLPTNLCCTVGEETMHDVFF